MAKRIVVVANKWWEADPLCAVLIHDQARPSGFSKFTYPRFPAARAAKPAAGEPRPPDPAALPRLTFEVNGVAVEVWCLEELMNPAESSSSSAEKARVLPGAIATGVAPNLVIAFGTAGIREGVSANGCVVVGRRTFIHDPLATAPSRAGMWSPPKPDELVDSDLPAGALAKLDAQARYAAEARFLRSPVQPTASPMIFVGSGFASLGIVNITNYDDYVWADASGVAAFVNANARAQIGSIETTHGIIRTVAAAPFLFVSGITDTEGLFDLQVTPRPYAQNWTAAHNAGLALAWLLPSIASIV